jgi:dimethylargininase
VINVEAPFVSGDAGILNEALVVSPSFLLEREMPIQGESTPIVERAIESHAVFVHRLRAAGVSVRIFDRPTSVPLLSSIGDVVVFFRDGAFLMRPTDPARRRETVAVEAFLCELKIPIMGRIEAPGLLDGGDVIVAGHTAFVGVPQERQGLIGVPKAPHGNATGRAQLRAFAAITGLKVVEVAIAADVRRLRAVASLIDVETMLYAPRVVDGAAFEKLRTIEVPAGQEYGAGVLALGRKRVVANLRFGGIVPLLRKAKFSVDAIDLWEFGKVGITPSFLAAALKRIPD